MMPTEKFEMISDLLKVSSSTVIKKKEISQQIYEIIFNWITDTAESPENILTIMYHIKWYGGPFKHTVTFSFLLVLTYLEALARRRPSIIEGSWEQVVWVIVQISKSIEYSSYEELFRFDINITVKHWILEVCSPNLCPNLYLRLELFRFMRIFSIIGDNTFHVSLVNTLCEIQNNSSKFDFSKIFFCSAKDVMYVIQTNHLQLEDIMNKDHPESKKVGLIAAIVKVTCVCTGLRDDNLACLHFCGLTPDLDRDLGDFASFVCNNILLKECIAETLNCIRDVFKRCSSVDTKLEKIHSSLLREEERLMPLHLCKRELNGLTPSVMCRPWSEALKGDQYDSDLDGYTTDGDIDDESID